MPWDKESEEAFPAKHSREPKGLRQDILDEIADHLACATEREHEQDETGDEETVWRRVLDKFGDPDTVARRLWWDQMRETVMREWIQTGVMIVVGLAIVVFMALVVRQMNTSNQTVLEALRANSVATNPMVSFKVKATRGSETGDVAAGVSLMLRGNAFGEESAVISRDTDQNGLVSFGPMRPGTYSVWANQGSAAGMSMLEGKAVTVFAGEMDHVVPLVLPDVEPRTIAIHFDVEPPLNLSRFMLVRFESGWERGDTRYVAGIDGWLNHEGQWGRDDNIADDRSPALIAFDSRGNTGMHWHSYSQERYPLQVVGDLGYVALSLCQRTGGGNIRKIAFHGYPSTEFRVSEDGGDIHLTMPEIFEEQFAQWRAEDHAAAQGIKLDDNLWKKLRREYPNYLVDQAEGVGESRLGFRWSGGLSRPDREDFNGTLLVTSPMNWGFVMRSRGAQVEQLAAYNGVLSVPEAEALAAPAGSRILLVLFVKDSNLQEFNNDFQVWSIVNDVLGKEWAPVAAEEGDPPQVQPEFAEGPAVTIPNEVMERTLKDGNWVLLDLTDALLPGEGEAYPTDLLLRWEQEEAGYKSEIRFVGADATELDKKDLRPMWLVLHPMD